MAGELDVREMRENLLDLAYAVDIKTHYLTKDDWINLSIAIAPSEQGAVFACCHWVRGCVQFLTIRNTCSKFRVVIFRFRKR